MAIIKQTITDSEYSVMKILWDSDEKLAVADVVSKLDGNEWSASTVSTFLQRLLKKGVVYQKWSVRNLPDEYELSGPLETLPIGSCDMESLFYKIVWAFSWFFFPLFVISMLDLLYKQYYNKARNLNNEYE